MQFSLALVSHTLGLGLILEAGRTVFFILFSEKICLANWKKPRAGFVLLATVLFRSTLCAQVIFYGRTSQKEGSNASNLVAL